LAQPGVIVLSETPSRTLSWVVHTPLLPTSSYKEHSGRTYRHAEVGPTTVSVCSLTQTEALRRPPLAFLRASGRPRSCPSFFVGASLSSRSFGWVRGESRAPKSRARWSQSSRRQDPAHHLLGWPMLIYDEAALPVQPASCAPCRYRMRTCPPLGPCRHHSLSCGLFLSSLRLALELSFV